MQDEVVVDLTIKITITSFSSSRLDIPQLSIDKRTRIAAWLLNHSRTKADSRFRTHHTQLLAAQQ